MYEDNSKGWLKAWFYLMSRQATDNSNEISLCQKCTQISLWSIFKNAAHHNFQLTCYTATNWLLPISIQWFAPWNVTLKFYHLMEHIFWKCITLCDCVMFEELIFAMKKHSWNSKFVRNEIRHWVLCWYDKLQVIKMKRLWYFGKLQTSLLCDQNRFTALHEIFQRKCSETFHNRFPLTRFLPQMGIVPGWEERLITKFLILLASLPQTSLFVFAILAGSACCISCKIWGIVCLYYHGIS